MNNFVIFSCGYNCENYIYNHLSSIHNQEYRNFDHIMVDDASTDSTYNKLVNGAGSRNFNHNLYNKKWIYNAASYLRVKDDDIVIIVDLDDC